MFILAYPWWATAQTLKTVKASFAEKPELPEICWQELSLARVCKLCTTERVSVAHSTLLQQSTPAGVSDFLIFAFVAHVIIIRYSILPLNVAGGMRSPPPPNFFNKN